MNKLSTERRVPILGMLVEGMSMRAITRLTGASLNTVAKLLMDSAGAAAAYHDEYVRSIRSWRHIQCDEIWSFIYAKEAHVAYAKNPPPEAGDIWTFTAIDSKSKLIISYLIGPRDNATAIEFMDDLASRITERPQISTDGLKAYREAVDWAFGGDVDFAEIIKSYVRDDADDRRYSLSKCTKMEKIKAAGQALRDARAVLLHLQLGKAARGRTDEAEQSHHAGDGRWNRRSSGDASRVGRADRRARPRRPLRTEVQEKKSKLTHYPPTRNMDATATVAYNCSHARKYRCK